MPALSTVPLKWDGVIPMWAASHAESQPLSPKFELEISPSKLQPDNLGQAVSQ